MTNLHMAINITKFLTRFAEEAVEHCDRLEAGLLALESGSDLQMTIDDLFRSAHTLKGTARMLKLGAIEKTACHMEDVLDALRSGRLAFSKELSDVLLECADAIRSLTAGIVSGRALQEDVHPVWEKLANALTETTEPGLREMNNPAKTDKSAGDLNDTAEPVAGDIVRIRADKLDDLIKLMGEFIGHHYRKTRHMVELNDIVSLAERNMVLAARDGDDQGMHQELVSTAKTLYARLQRLKGLLRDYAAHEGHLTENLQDSSLKMRMVPLSTVFDAFHRTVRDLARETGKEIDFRIDGGDTELDRKIIEQIGDALLHMIRNAVDHGIELPKVREASGKNARGLIQLTACYDSGGVSIVLQDDGAGISLDKIKERALQRQLVEEQAMSKMNERQWLEMIFIPGFSTSPIITDLSGRGVGMDVVRKSIVEDLKGSIEIISKEGEGTTFLIKVPITLALSRMLLVSAEKCTFALPANFVQEVVSIAKSDIIEVLDKRVIRLREQFLPVEELQSLLKCPDAAPRERQEQMIAIVHAGSDKLGLIVDAVLDEADMVIKSLPAALKNLRLVSGVAIGSDNEVISVLNVASLIKFAREGRQHIAMAPKPEDRQKEILVVDDSINTRELEKNILEAYGYSVDVANDGIEALDKVNQRNYDLIITDIEMPKLDGFNLTARLKQSEQYREVPIIIVTSRARDEDKRRGIQSGANAYIVKGAFDQDNLINTVQNLIGS